MSDEPRSPIGRQFAALGVPLEHPYTRIRGVIARGMADDMVRSLDEHLTNMGQEPTDASDRIAIDEITQEVARSAVERALHPDPDISIPARHAIHRKVQEYRRRRG